MTDLTDALRNTIRTVPDWPAAGVQFRDITPVFADGVLFDAVIKYLAQRYQTLPNAVIAGVDARGFIIGAALAHALGAGFVPLRKQGKLPHHTVSEAYVLEYGEATLEIHIDAITPGQTVVLVDDLIATGGTMLAAASLIRRLGGHLYEAVAIIDLPDLGGSRRLADAGVNTRSLISFSGH